MIRLYSCCSYWSRWRSWTEMPLKGRLELRSTVWVRSSSSWLWQSCPHLVHLGGVWVVQEVRRPHANPSQPQRLGHVLVLHRETVDVVEPHLTTTSSSWLLVLSSFLDIFHEVQVRRLGKLVPKNSSRLRHELGHDVLVGELLASGVGAGRAAEGHVGDVAGLGHVSRCCHACTVIDTAVFINSQMESVVLGPCLGPAYAAGLLFRVSLKAHGDFNPLNCRWRHVQGASSFFRTLIFISYIFYKFHASCYAAWTRQLTTCFALIEDKI